MASMRRLNRRLLRWRRYADKTYWNPRVATPWWTTARSATCSPGHTRAWNAVQREVERRFWDETPEVWLGGPEGEAALIADVHSDDARRIAEHAHACWDGCDDLHTCEYCGEPDCAGDCDEAFADFDDDGDPWPLVVTERAFAEQGLL